MGGVATGQEGLLLPPRKIRSRKSKRPVDDSKTAVFEKPVLTATFFIERGSRLVMDQIRAPNAYRETTSFCRTDIGEFTNMSKGISLLNTVNNTPSNTVNTLLTFNSPSRPPLITPMSPPLTLITPCQGRAVREFEFMYNLEKDGKNRISERLQLQAKLRHHCGKDYQHASVKKIEGLLARAKPLGGSVLQLEVGLAEKFLARLRQWLRRLLVCQKVARGYVTRQILRRQQSEEAARLEALRQRARASKAFARGFVTDLLSSCMRRHAGETRARARDRAILRLMQSNNIPSQYTMSTHLLSIFCQHTFSMHSANTPFLPTHPSTHSPTYPPMDSYLST